MVKSVFFRQSSVRWLGVFACALLALGSGARVLQQQPRFDGEYGLVVYVRADSLHVHWLTVPAAAGSLEILESGSRATSPNVLARVETSAGVAHRAALRLPRPAEIVLRYGAKDATRRHETTVTLSAPRRAPGTVSATDSLYVVGDTHGLYDELIAGLRNGSLIDSAGHWTGGRKQLVFAGDLVDRGPDVVRLLWFVYRLEREAAAAGGRVHVVLGNHELMVMLGDLRYVHAKEAQIAQAHGITYDRLLDVRASVLGRWLAAKPGVLRVGDVLIAHGGVSGQHAQQSIQQLNDSLSAYMREDVFYYWNDTTRAVALDSASYQRRVDFIWDANSIFWHRGYIQTDTMAAELTDVLQRMDAQVHVIGHTAMPTIQSRYDGRIIAAHSPKFGAELVLLVRTRDGMQRFIVGRSGGPPVAF